MGCGESKPEVATSNTILRRKKSSVGGSSKKSKDIETVLGNIDSSAANGNSTVPQHHDQQPPADQKSSEQVKEDNVNNANGGGGESVVADNLKDINVNNTDGDDDNYDKETLDQGNIEEHDDAADRLFSSRKIEEEGIDGIISEGRSGTSDYYTPRHGAGSKGNLHFKADDDILEDNAELALGAETKAPETQNNEDPAKAEENSGKEAEVAVTTSTFEAKVSLPAEEEKN